MTQVSPGENIAGMASPPAPSGQKPDYGLFVGILFGIASIFFFVLQSDGVEVNWLWSVAIYAACTIGVVWTTAKHALPGKGKATRYTVTSILVLLCVALGSIGTVKQYHKEHSAVVEKPSSPVPVSDPSPINGFLQLGRNSVYPYQGKYWVDTTYENPGGQPVGNALIAAEVSLSDTRKEKYPGDVDTLLAQDFQHRITKGLKSNPVQGSSVGVGKALWTSVRVPDFPKGAKDGIRDGTWRIYFLSMARWGDGMPEHQQWNCFWASGISFPLSAQQQETLHNCEIHLKKIAVRNPGPEIIPHPCPKEGIDINVQGGVIKNIHSSGCFQTGVSIKGSPGTVDGVTADTGTPSKQP